MVSVARMIPQNKPRRKEITHYHTIASGVLQSRFGALLRVLGVLCWAVSLILGFPTRMGWLWWFLPIRAVPIMLSAGLVLLLRKKKLHVETSKCLSSFAELWNRFTNQNGFLVVFLTYSMSSAIYYYLIKYNMKDMGLRTKELNLNSYELPRLNERYLYMTTFPIFIAFGYSLVHLYYDYDYLQFDSIAKPVNRGPAEKLQRKASTIFLRSGIGSVVSTTLYPICYWVFRRPIWKTSLFLVKYSFFKLHRSGEYISFPVGTDIFALTLVSSFFIFIIWESMNVGFSIYMSLGPLSRGVLLSSKSTDPNGTLITGLKSAGRPLTRILAFQELLHISVHDRVRRIAIYADIDRPIDQFGAVAKESTPTTSPSTTTSVWGEIYKECHSIADELTTKLTSISEKNKPEKSEQEKPPTLSIDIHNHQTNQSNAINAVNNRNSHLTVLKTDTNIFLKPNNSNSTSSSLRTRQIVDNFQDKDANRSKEVISLVNKTKGLIKTFLSQYKSLLEYFLSTRLGAPFRHTLKKQTDALVPNITLINEALLALSYLVCFSLDEDNLGTVQRYLPDVLTTYYNLIQALEKYTNNPPIHWTNPASSEDIYTATQRTREVLEAVEPAFELIAVRFLPFLDSLKLSDPVHNRAVQTATQSEIRL